jgi:hypothetical protein
MIHRAQAPSPTSLPGSGSRPRTHAAARRHRPARGKTHPTSSSRSSNWSAHSSARSRSVTTGGISSTCACIHSRYPLQRSTNYHKPPTYN